MLHSKIIVIDDDPTGSQTVHSCLLLTQWDTETLRKAMLDTAPLFFILSNTRGLDAQRAADLTREICQNIKLVLDALKEQEHVINPILVSRSDSTLRGHYPVETDIIAEQLGPFDAHFLVPAFFEGGRITRDSTHYLVADGEEIPVHKTEFAHDSVFSYSHSYLPDYIEEKTQGRIKADEVECFLLNEVRNNSLTHLLHLENNVCCAVDCENQDDLDNFSQQLKQASQQGKRFLFRSAASLLTSLADLPPQPVAANAMHHYVRNAKPGAIIIGSHVKKTTLQLEQLIKQTNVIEIEVDVERIASDRSKLLTEITTKLNDAHKSNLSFVIYTSRVEKTFTDQQTRLAFGEQVSKFLMDIVRNLPNTLGFLISKGGITSNDVLSSGLALRTSRVVGQILPGCSVVCCPNDHPQFPELPVVIFPGNVGDNNALATAYNRLSAKK